MKVDQINPNIRKEESLILSATADVTMANVIAAKAIWNTMNTISGSFSPSSATFIKATLSKDPMMPMISDPKESEYPKNIHCNEIKANEINESVIIEIIFFRWTRPA